MMLLLLPADKRSINAWPTCSPSAVKGTSMLVSDGVASVAWAEEPRQMSERSQGTLSERRRATSKVMSAVSSVSVTSAVGR